VWANDPRLLLASVCLMDTSCDEQPHEAAYDQTGDDADDHCVLQRRHGDGVVIAVDEVVVEGEEDEHWKSPEQESSLEDEDGGSCLVVLQCDLPPGLLVGEAEVGHRFLSGCDR
jgi:hypothetical protein